MPRFKDYNWKLPAGEGNAIKDWPSARLAVLMDIRDELKEINTSLRCLRCRNFLRIPAKLDRIGRNTEKRKRANTGPA